MEVDAAMRAVVECTRDATKLTDEQVEALVDNEATPENQKLLLTRLFGHGLIDAEQLTFAIAYRWPLKGA